MSDAYEQMNHWLIELGQSHGHRFVLDDAGRCFLVNSKGSRLVIHAPRSSEFYYLTAEIAPRPTVGAEAIYELALNLNLFLQETRGAAIAIDQVANSLVLCYSREIDETDYAAFNNILNNLLDTAEDMKARLEAPDIQQSDAPSDTPFDNTEFMVQV